MNTDKDQFDKYNSDGWYREAQDQRDSMGADENASPLTCLVWGFITLFVLAILGFLYGAHLFSLYQQGII